MKRILVLLSTYNGEDYIKEQLDSLFSQNDVLIHILARDDNSHDQTLSILRSYEKDSKDITVLSGENMGPARSFYELMLYAFNNMERYDYYSFCDQDDIWYSDKLYLAVKELEKRDNALGFYFSNFDIINENGVCFSKGLIPPRINYKTVLFRNPCLGCSQVFTYELLEQGCEVIQYVKKTNNDVLNKMLHDSFMARLAYYLDSYVVCDRENRFAYRQHKHNVTHYTGKSRLHKFLENFKTYSKLYPAPFSREASILLAVERKRISREKQIFLEMVGDYQKSIWKTLKFAFLYASQFKNQLSIAAYVFVLIIFRRF
ncbi:MAG: glycosyltransferase [Bacteroidota bacterium]|nr:glycosyltransferase [Bacteroidota bacterium]